MGYSVVNVEYRLANVYGITDIADPARRAVPLN
jgi:hypothetical protein